MRQRSSERYLAPSPPLVRKLNRKIMLMSHYFKRIRLNADLFRTGDIENITQAIEAYEKFDKKFH